MRVDQLAETAYVVELDSNNMSEVDFGRLKQSFPGLLDYAPAFGRLALFFEGELPEPIVIEKAILELPPRNSALQSQTVPICFEIGEDFETACKFLSIEASEFKGKFLGTRFRVEAIGFSPGFPYMSGLPESLSSLPRRSSPRPRIEPGTVGLAEDMCGIYPMLSPGGWNLIGRTPLVIADLNTSYFRFEVGDLVRFEEISLTQFEASGK